MRFLDHNSAVADWLAELENQETQAALLSLCNMLQILIIFNELFRSNFRLFCVSSD